MASHSDNSLFPKLDQAVAWCASRANSCPYALSVDSDTGDHHVVKHVVLFVSTSPGAHTMVFDPDLSLWCRGQDVVVHFTSLLPHSADSACFPENDSLTVKRPVYSITASNNGVVVWKCILKRDLNISVTGMPTFIHWSSDSQKFGLKFGSELDCRQFSQVLHRVHRELTLSTAPLLTCLQQDTTAVRVNQHLPTVKTVENNGTCSASPMKTASKATRLKRMLFLGKSSSADKPCPTIPPFGSLTAAEEKLITAAPQNNICKPTSSYNWPRHKLKYQISNQSDTQQKSSNKSLQHLNTLSSLNKNEKSQSVDQSELRQQSLPSNRSPESVRAPGFVLFVPGSDAGVFKTYDESTVCSNCQNAPKCSKLRHATTSISGNRPRLTRMEGLDYHDEKVESVLRSRSGLSSCASSTFESFDDSASVNSHTSQRKRRGPVPPEGLLAHFHHNSSGGGIPKRLVKQASAPSRVLPQQTTKAASPLTKLKHQFRVTRHSSESVENVSNQASQNFHCTICGSLFQTETNFRGSCHKAKDKFKSFIDYATGMFVIRRIRAFHSGQQRRTEHQPCGFSSKPTHWLLCGLASLIAPCLCCYLPLRGIHSLARKSRMCGAKHLHRSNSSRSLITTRNNASSINNISTSTRLGGGQPRALRCYAASKPNSVVEQPNFLIKQSQSSGYSSSQA